MAVVYYQHPSDNVAPDATWSVQTGVEDTDYPASYIADERLTRPAKLTGTTGAWMADFGAAQRVDFIALGVHNIDAGATVLVQGNGADNWAAPTCSATLTIDAADADGRVSGAWADLTAATGYSAGGFRYWRLAVTAGNTSTLAVGEVWLGTGLRTFGVPFEWNFDTTDLRRTVTHRTDYGVRTVYDLLVRQRTFRCRFRASDADLVLLRAWHRAAKGSVEPVVVVPDVTLNDAWWVYLPDVLNVTTQYTDVNDVELTLDELSPGIPL